MAHLEYFDRQEDSLDQAISKLERVVEALTWSICGDEVSFSSNLPYNKRIANLTSLIEELV